MMSFLKKYRKRKKQDRLARKIAARYGMTAEYEAARKGGVSPLEALKDWDMVKEEERKKLEEVESSEIGNGSLVVSILALIVSAATLVFSINSNNKTNTLTERINSKEFQMSQSMKSDLVELVAALRSVDDKAALAKETHDDIDFSYELQLLNDIQTRPGYLVFLYSLQNDRNRFEVEDELKWLTGVCLVPNRSTKTCIMYHTEKILEIIENNSNLKDMNVINFDEMLQFLVKARNHEKVGLKEFSEEFVSREKDFLENLMRQYDDPNIQYFYYTYVVIDSVLANQACEAGASPIEFDSTYDLDYWGKWSVGKQVLWMWLLDDYEDEYYEFMINR